MLRRSHGLWHVPCASTDGEAHNLHVPSSLRQQRLTTIDHTLRGIDLVPPEPLLRWGRDHHHNPVLERMEIEQEKRKRAEKGEKKSRKNQTLRINKNMRHHTSESCPNQSRWISVNPPFAHSSTWLRAVSNKFSIDGWLQRNKISFLPAAEREDLSNFPMNSPNSSSKCVKFEIFDSLELSQHYLES